MNLSNDTLRKLRGLIVFTAVIFVLAWNWKLCFEALSVAAGLLSPFVTGACIAFVLNLPMRFLERHLQFLRRAGVRRAVSLLLTLILLLFVFALVTMLVIPQIGSSLLSLQEKVPAFLNSTSIWLNAFFRDNPQLVTYLDSLKTNVDEIYASLQALLTKGATGLLSGSLLAAKGILSGATSLGIGMIFAIYILIGKEKLGRQCQRFLAAFLPADKKKLVLRVLALANTRFSAFIAGQCLEACILGSMFVVTLTLLRLPYAVLIGVLIAVTALIPVFGAFIGFLIGAFLMLLQSPMAALIFSIVFLVLQQLEGNLIYPHVVGGSVELPAIWVLVAVTTGGTGFGVMGMIVFIPLFSVVYALLGGIVRYRLGEPPADGSSEVKEAVAAVTAQEIGTNAAKNELPADQKTAGSALGKEQVCKMKAQNIADLDSFIRVIDACKGPVELVSPEGDCINLKSKLSQYLSLASMISNGYMKELDLVAEDKEDVERLTQYLYGEHAE